MNQKTQPFRSLHYLAFVRSLPCCMCGAPADDAHHVIGLHWGLGGSGTKAGDEYGIPACRQCHNAIHGNPELQQMQPAWLEQTIRAGLWHFGNDCEIGRRLCLARDFIRTKGVAA